MKDISLHILDLLQNSLTAGATRITVAVWAWPETGILRVIIEDNGTGMDGELLKRVTDPFTTTRTTRKVGLGIPMMKVSAEKSGGGFEITSVAGKGTKVDVFFITDNIDRPPLGDIAGTITGFIASGTSCELKLVLGNGKETFTFNSSEISGKLGDVPITEYAVVVWINEYLNEGIKMIFGGVLDEIDS